jgi:hypothetical protein
MIVFMANRGGKHRLSVVGAEDESSAFDVRARAHAEQRQSADGVL